MAYNALPSYQPGGQIDFAPVQNAFSQVAATNARNNALAFQQKELDATIAQRGIENARAARQDQLALIDTQGQQANALDQTLPVGSPQRAAAWSAFMANHAKNFPNDQPTAEELDPIAGPKIYAAQAKMALVNPIDIAAKRATIGLTSAETDKARAEAALARAQFAGINNPDEALFGGSSTEPAAAPATPANALATPAPQAAAPSNALAPRGPVQSYARGVSSGVPGINVGPTPGQPQAAPASPVMAPGVTPTGLPTAPPAGAPTAASGAVSPSMQSNPSYFSPEDRAIYRTALLNPRAAAALEKTPGFIQRKTEAETVGKELGSLQERQRGGGDILKGMDTLTDLINSSDDETLSGAIGPNNYARVTPSAVAPLDYNAWTAPKPDKYEDLPTRAKANYMYNKTPQAEKAYNLQNSIDHLTSTLTDEFIGATNGIKMSDSRQAEFKAAIGALRDSTTKEEALKIAKTARAMIENTFHLPKGYKAPVYTAPAGAVPSNTGWSYVAPVGGK
jgi:hypothetical protein